VAILYFFRIDGMCQESGKCIFSQLKFGITNSDSADARLKAHMCCPPGSSVSDRCSYRRELIMDIDTAKAVESALIKALPTSRLFELREGRREWAEMPCEWDQDDFLSALDDLLGKAWDTATDQMIEAQDAFMMKRHVRLKLGQLMRADRAREAEDRKLRAARGRPQ